MRNTTGIFHHVDILGTEQAMLLARNTKRAFVMLWANGPINIMTDNTASAAIGLPVKPMYETVANYYYVAPICLFDEAHPYTGEIWAYALGNTGVEIIEFEY